MVEYLVILVVILFLITHDNYNDQLNKVDRNVLSLSSRIV